LPKAFGEAKLPLDKMGSFRRTNRQQMERENKNCLVC